MTMMKSLIGILRNRGLRIDDFAVYCESLKSIRDLLAHAFGLVNLLVICYPFDFRSRGDRPCVLALCAQDQERHGD